MTQEKTGTGNGSERPGGFDATVDALCAQNVHLLSGHAHGLGLPSRASLDEVMIQLRAALFPAHFGPADLSPESLRYHTGAALDAALRTLEDQVRRALSFAASNGNAPAHADRAKDIIRDFASRLPAVRELLGTDVRAAYEGDPAATSPNEAILS